MKRSGNTTTATAFRIRRAVAAFALASFTFFGTPSWAPGSPPLEPLADQAPTSVTERELSTSPEGIRFRIEQRPLGDVLQAVRNRTSVEFELAPGVRDIPVTAGFDCPDWASGLRRLLRDFDHVLIYDDDGRLRRAVVTGPRDASQAGTPSDEPTEPESEGPSEDARAMDGPPADSGMDPSSGPPEQAGSAGEGPPETTPHRAGPPEGGHHPGPPGAQGELGED